MEDGTEHYLHRDIGRNQQADRRTDEEKTRELEEDSAELRKSIAVDSAEIEQLKTKCRLRYDDIESHRLNGCQIPPECTAALCQVKSSLDCPSTPVGIFSGSPVADRQPNVRPLLPKKKTSKKSAPRVKGNKASAVQCVNPVTRPDVCGVSHNGFKTTGTRSSTDINGQTEMMLVKFPQPSNVSTPVSSKLMTGASDNRPYLGTQGLHNSQHLYTQQSTHGTNALAHSGDVSKNTTKHHGTTACGQVLNQNSQSHSCQYSSQASGQYTADKAAFSVLASNNGVPQQLNRQPSMTMVSTDMPIGDTISSNKGFLVGPPTCYTNPQQNDLHNCTQANIICMPTMTALTKAVSNTDLPTSDQILSTPQGQQPQQYPQMTRMHRQRYEMVTPNYRMFTSNQDLLNKLPQQNLQDVSQIINASASRQAVSTTAAPSGGELVGFCVLRTSSHPPVVQYSAQTAQLSPVSVIESDTATSSQHCAQKAQLSSLSIDESGTAASSQTVHTKLPQPPLHQISHSPTVEIHYDNPHVATSTTDRHIQQTAQPTFLSTSLPQNMQAAVSDGSTSFASFASSPSDYMTQISHPIGVSAGGTGCNEYTSEIPDLSFQDLFFDDKAYY